MGLVVVGFGLLNITIWYLILDKLIYTPEHMRRGLEFLGLTLVPKGMEPGHKLVEITTTMITFGMGASTQALFARVGGGIYTKAADIGADMVGKVEAGIPEDDPRNPATIADNVGDNVGDVAGMGADLFESYCNSILATAALGTALSVSVLAEKGMDPLKAVLAPTLVAGLGIVLSIVGIFLVRCRKDATQKNLLHALLRGTLSSSVLIIIAYGHIASYKQKCCRHIRCNHTGPFDCTGYCNSCPVPRASCPEGESANGLFGFGIGCHYRSGKIQTSFAGS
ncbi:unnamed protein product [marine sediment metagenome]|uniref:H(+)-exporting diphosphatase n=1 Tax=marine sediment metagenome TaxID=412755 RepID=X0YJ09_9ZZZZ